MMSDLVGIPALSCVAVRQWPLLERQRFTRYPEQRDRVLLAAMGSTDGLTDEVDLASLAVLGAAHRLPAKRRSCHAATPTVSTSTTICSSVV